MLPVGCRSSFPVTNKHKDTIGRMRWCLAVMCNFTCRTTPSALLGIVSTTRPRGHWPQGLFLSTTDTKSPTSSCSCCFVHFFRSVKCWTYSCIHRFQKCSTISWLCWTVSWKLRRLVAPTFLTEITVKLERTGNGLELKAPDLRCLHLNVSVAANLAMMKLQPQRQIALYLWLVDFRALFS